jgi:hypothetical protein
MAIFGQRSTWTFATRAHQKISSASNTRSAQFTHVDLLGEVTGIGGYCDMALQADIITAYDVSFKLIALDDLIRSKAAAGRPKDLLDLEALRALRK